MSKNYRVSAMLNTEEYELLEDLKKYYSTNTSNILKSGLALLNDIKPPLLISQTVSKVDKTNIIFNKILNLQKIDGRKINIFTGQFSDSERVTILYSIRAMSEGESLIIRIAAHRWTAFQRTISFTNSFGKVMIAYKRCTDEKYTLIIVDLEDVREPLFKAQSDGTHLFYLTRVQPEHLVKSKEYLGNKYDEILKTLNEENEEEN